MPRRCWLSYMLCNMFPVTSSNLLFFSLFSDNEDAAMLLCGLKIEILSRPPSIFLSCTCCDLCVPCVLHMHAVQIGITHSDFQLMPIISYFSPALLEASLRMSIHLASLSSTLDKGENGEPYQRRKGAGGSQLDGSAPSQTFRDSTPLPPSSSWRRIMLLILAITIHNIPGKHLSVFYC